MKAEGIVGWGTQSAFGFLTKEKVSASDGLGKKIGGKNCMYFCIFFVFFS